MQSKLVNEKDAAKYISMSVSYLRLSRMTGNLPNRTPAPPYHKIGKAVRYSLDDLDNFLADRRITLDGEAEESHQSESGSL